MNAIDSLGLPCDGRLLALNSYENRVYQVGQDEGPPLVAKFYRPERWSREAILEEHAFTLELAGRELPVVPPILHQGQTLHQFDGFQFAIFNKHGGRAPELESASTLEWMGRFIGRIHAVGALQPFTHRPELNISTFGTEPRDFLLSHDFIPPALKPAWQSAVALALDGVRRNFDRAGDVADRKSTRLNSSH